MGELTADVLRELGASTLVFRSLKHAVSWFNGFGGGGSDLGSSGGGCPRPRESIEIDNATYAALLLCFRWRDPGVDDEDMRTLLGATLDYVVGEYSLVYLAERHGLGEQGFTRWVARGERVLRKRLQVRGLLPPPADRCDCGCGARQVA
jgi:hypothetical protein